MLLTNLRLLFRLYLEPSAAMGDILDRGSLLFHSLAVLTAFWVAGLLLPGLPFSFYAPLLVLAVFYVPGILLIANIVGWSAGSFGNAFRRDYASLLTCTAAGWTAANLPLLILLRLKPELVPWLVAATCVGFLLLEFFAVRTVFGTGNAPAGIIVSLSWIPLVVAYFLWQPLQHVVGFLASPFFLFYGFYFLRGEFGSLGDALRSRQSFRRNLELSTINPHDGEAQYQLGLIFQQRRQFAEAIRRFQNAVAIDPSHTDAHFQSGRIAREQGRNKDALLHFQAVIDQNEQHSHSEVLREIGAIYIAAHQYRDALQELTRYQERRPYDTEGLFYYGQALEGLGRMQEAREAWQRAIEAANMAPSYIRRVAARWSRLAEKQLRKVAGE